MARLRLTIGNISVSTQIKTSSVAIPTDLAEVTGYDISLGEFSFKKKMYQPTEVLADLQISMSNGKSSEWKPLNRKTIEKMFKHKRASLEVMDYQDETIEGGNVVDIIGDDYFVHEVRPCYHPDSMTVKLKIYSLDKLMTLSRYCKSWTAKKLNEHILKSELPKYKVPYNQDEQVACDTSAMKHLLKDGQEHIFPYLVQYNESFYDMLIRTCNRWGEFVYWEDGKLHIGCDSDKVEAKEISGYHTITFQDYASEQPIEKDGTYTAEAPYDNNVLNSKVVKDGAAKVFATINNMTDMEAGADYYWLRKVGQVLTNNKPIMNFMFDTAVNDLIAWGQQESMAKQYNDDHNDAYFKKKKKGISTLDEQYTKDGKTLNQWSESSPIVGAKQYAEILAGEMTAEQNIIDIDYDTTWPGLKLGDIIKANDEEFIVVEIASRDKDKFQVKAIAKGDGAFYPTMIPAGHIRTSGPQVAVVVDADDPTKKNRVRLEYPWQLTKVNPVYEKITAADLKGFDVSDATPWLLYAASSGPASAGVHGKHYLAEKVLVNYANNNVERPFVVGAVSTETPGSIKTAAAVMQAPNGEFIKVHEGSGKGATAFMSNFTPGLSLASGFVNFPDFFGSDNQMSKAFEGGVEMGDRYGVWNISCSTDKRSIKINSPWGDVAINAFTGITINAPNGDVRIKGKNVSIEAGNNLSLKSGTNITNKFISSYGGSGGFNFTSFMYDATSMATKKLASMVESVFDLSLIRSLIEVYWRPQEGALSIQSNRYLKMGAGGAMPGYPDAAYLNPKKLQERDEKMLDKQLPDTLKMGPAMQKLLGKLPHIADAMIVRYKGRYNNCISKKSELEKAINRLFDYSDATEISGVCNGYDALKAKLWDPNTKKLTEADLGFTDACASDSIDKVGMTAFGRAQTADRAYNEKFSKKLDSVFKNYMLKRRVECKKDVVDKANALLESIIILRTDPMKLGDLIASGVGVTKWKAPADSIKALLDAISAEKCKDTTFYKYTCDQDSVITDERADLTNAILASVNFRKTALIRQAALNLMEGWGMESKPCKYKWENDKVVASDQTIQPARPANEDDLENEEKWNLYVRSLQFTKPVSSKPSLMDEVAAVFDPSNLNLATPIREYYSWGNAKAGQILFGTGATYSMKADGTISKLETHRNQARISRALLSEKDQADFDQLNNSVQLTLMKLGSADVPVALNVNQAQDDVANAANNVNDANDANNVGNGNDESLVIESII